MEPDSYPHVLILGANGQVGRALCREIEGKTRVTATSRKSDPVIDLCDPDSIPEIVARINPDIVINAAAYTAVDKAESEPDLAFLVNVEAPGVIADACSDMGIPLIHYSTDYVFDGHNTQPYTEDDQTCPINVYGKSKLAGEQAIQDAGVRHFIFRTSWVYDAHGKNFLNTMLRLATEKESLTIVNDQLGSPTWARYIAQETGRIILSPDFDVYETGLYHLTCSGETSWLEFAEAIFDNALRQHLIEKKPALTGIPTEKYPTPAKRPLFSKLNTQKAKRKLHVQEMAWQTGLLKCMEELTG